MSCNAYNHPPDCNCGWGGIFHGLGDIKNALHWPMAPGSFINPNAHCPVCNTPVFFYRSPDGGRVFFDALGTPWPKHPCTASAASQAVPSSTYWRAREYLACIKVKAPPLSILTGPQKLMDQWRMELFQRWIRDGNLRHLVALWVLDLSPAALGVTDVNFGRVNLALTTAMAHSIQRYFEGRKTKKTELFCLELARSVIKRETQKSVSPALTTPR